MIITTLVEQTIELLKLSYHPEASIAYEAECNIYENFKQMTSEEFECYTLLAYPYSQLELVD